MLPVCAGLILPASGPPSGHYPSKILTPWPRAGIRCGLLPPATSPGGVDHIHDGTHLIGAHIQISCPWADMTTISRTSWLEMEPRNSPVLESDTGSTVREFSVIRCSASSTKSSGDARGVSLRSTLASGVLSHSPRGRYRSMLSETIPK